MAKRELELTTRLTREDVAGVIEALVDGLKEGLIKVQKSDDVLELVVPRVIDLEIEAKVSDERAKFEIEVSWRTNRAENPDAPDAAEDPHDPHEPDDDDGDDDDDDDNDDDKDKGHDKGKKKAGKKPFSASPAPDAARELKKKSARTAGKAERKTKTATPAANADAIIAPSASSDPQAGSGAEPGAGKAATAKTAIARMKKPGRGKKGDIPPR